MEADSSHLSGRVTPEPATERNEVQNSQRILGSDLMVTKSEHSGLHQLLDQIEGIASPVLQFTHKWRDIHEEYSSVENMLKKRIVELEKKEERLKDVDERERKVDLREKSMALSLQENEVKQCLVSSILMRLDCETANEAATVLEERGKEVERLSKCNDDKSRELDKAVKEFDVKQKESIKQLEAREKAVKEKVIELEKKQESFDAERIIKAEEMELKRKEKLAELEKKEKLFEMELKAKTEEMKVKEKQLEEREKELELKQRELEQVMDKLKEREKETNSACLASASASSPQQRDKAYEEETEEEHEKIKIVDSEFHDFKQTISSFVVDKIWALYDPQDDMPRLYARIKRINKSQLSLDVTWLEPKDDESVPVACGRFTYGRTETVSHLTFSHELKPIIHGRNISVNPKEGETWAVFRDWSQSWENNPGQHKPPYRYDLVEVYEDQQGVGVTYLGKVEGFVSVFKHAVQHGVFKKVITPKEMQRFSHRVPSVRLNGEEREGVPAGSFELDPAAVPSYILLGGKGT
ncbi:hypothetical protein N665_0118s0035 [Sinapis alba]|nr:hypothetical protein N665_0118s0035 [Sinapis alba]